MCKIRALQGKKFRVRFRPRRARPTHLAYNNIGDKDNKYEEDQKDDEDYENDGDNEDDEDEFEDEDEFDDEDEDELVNDKGEKR